MSVTTECSGESQNRPCKRYFSSGPGFLFFVEASFHYISPRSFIDWVGFIIGLPRAFQRYRKAMNNHASVREEG